MLLFLGKASVVAVILQGSFEARIFRSCGAGRFSRQNRRFPEVQERFASLLRLREPDAAAAAARIGMLAWPCVSATEGASLPKPSASLGFCRLDRLAARHGTCMVGQKARRGFSNQNGHEE